LGKIKKGCSSVLLLTREEMIAFMTIYFMNLKKVTTFEDIMRIGNTVNSLDYCM